MDDTIQFVKERAKNMRYCSTSCVVLEILLELGVPTNMEGFAYLKDAIRLRYINPYWTVTNHIYPAISRKDGGLLSNDQIDTAIRGAINCAWEDADLVLWKLFFPTILKRRIKKPTNKEFIYELAYIVEMWRDCAEAYERQCSREVVSYEYKY